MVTSYNQTWFWGGSRPRTEKQMAPLDSWGHSASETGLCFSKLNISKFGIFWHDLDLTLQLGSPKWTQIARRPSPLYSKRKIAHKTCATPLIFVFYVWWPLWPDLDLEPSLISNIYSISVLPYISGVLEVSFGPKLIILRSLRLVTWKPRFWLLTWPWPDTWPHLENLGDALGSSHRELSNAASFVSLRPFVRELWRGGV